MTCCEHSLLMPPGNILEHKGKKYYQPPTLSWTQWMFVCGRKMEIAGRISEFSTECFHLFGHLIEKQVDSTTWEKWVLLHEIFHDFEHFSHGACLINDLISLKNRYYSQKSFSNFEVVQRVVRLVQHLFCFISMVGVLGVIPIAPHALCTYSSFLSLSHHVLFAFQHLQSSKKWNKKRFIEFFQIFTGIIGDGICVLRVLDLVVCLNKLTYFHSIIRISHVSAILFASYHHLPKMYVK